MRISDWSSDVCSSDLQSAARFGGAIEDFLEVVAKAHVEHFIGFVEDGDAERGEVERPTFEVIAQAPRRADDDLHALSERAAFLAGVRSEEHTSESSH